MNFNHFFMCGLPGGADYAMLFAVKHGWMDPLEEKRINAGINVWVREPALVVTATLGFIQLHTSNQDHFGWGIAVVRSFLMMLAMWNGLFFMERVVGNYHVCAYKAKQETKKAKGSDELAAPPMSPVAELPGSKADRRASDGFAYESKEHFTSGLPFMGMRVAVSRDDLQQLEKEYEAKKPTTRGDAYPIEGKKAL